jgi:hypothetical protein
MTQVTAQVQDTKTLNATLSNRASTDAGVESELRQIETEISHVLPGLKIRYSKISGDTQSHIKSAPCLGGICPGRLRVGEKLEEANTDFEEASSKWQTGFSEAGMASKASMLASLGKAVIKLETLAETFQFSYYISQPSSADAYNKSLDILKARECRESWLESFSKQEQKWWDLSMRTHSKQCDDAEVPAPLEEDEMKADTRASAHGGKYPAVTIDL